MTDLWTAPAAPASLDASIRIPGSKSLMNRALVLAALATGPSHLSQPLIARDTELMADAMEALGATIDRGADTWRVDPIVTNPDGHVDCGLAGTVMRFAPMLAALSDATTTFDGDPRARERPMSGTIEALRALGATVDDGGTGTLPFRVTGGPAVVGGPITVDASASSQFVSALLLIAPRLEKGLHLRHEGSGLPSVPHIDMTVTELRRRGVTVDTGTGTWRVHPGPIAGLDITVEPDLSNAGPFVATALVTGGTLRIRDWPETTDQAGDAWRWLVPAFGGSTHRDGTDLVITGGERLTGVTVDLHEVGELTPVVAALAALADGPSQITGVAHLRGHESDRLAALTHEINALGGAARELDDGLAIEPKHLSPGVFRTYADHRMAHAAAVIGLGVPGLQVEDIGTTAKTYPGFAEDWKTLLS